MEGQLTLFDSFNEAEGFQKKDLAEPTIEEVTLSSYRRSKTKGKREADLDGLPARIFEHRLSDEELDEKFPNGCKELPVEIHKRLHIIPETFMVDEHHVHVYASQSNDGIIIRAERPLDLFRNSIATPALVASIINGKYANALPLERQSRAYTCNGINLSTNTMSNWVINSTIGKALACSINQENTFVYSWMTEWFHPITTMQNRLSVLLASAERTSFSWNPTMAQKPAPCFTAL